MTRKTDGEFYVCGIGASAGGVEALEELFSSVDPDTRCAYVVIQHLSPDYESQMQKLLARRTRLPVEKITDGEKIRPHRIYLNLPGKEVILSQGRFCVTPSDMDEKVHLPIDHFFRSLAQDFGRHAIGVVLSGTGTDGSRGVVEIKRLGGLVLAQQAEDAQFDGMPKAAVQSGACDLALRAATVPEAISSYISDSLSPSQLVDQELVANRAGDVDRIEALLLQRYGINFANYKPSTILRRMDKRLATTGAKDLAEFRQLLEREPEELTRLYYDLLIGVTAFFRDLDVFQAVQKFFAGRAADVGEGLRVWVPACATGEEAYSLAILLREIALQHDYDVWPKVFATDVHEHALQFGARGVYPADRVTGVTQQLRQRYFDVVDEGLQVKEELRRAVVFARHNLLEDPPFTQMDLVSCRNLLIYFQAAAQERVLTLLHFSLKSQGILLLGSSETVAPIADEFEGIDSKHRIYRKRRNVRLVSQISNVDMTRGREKPLRVRPAGRSAADQYYEALLQRYAPPSFVVDTNFMLRHSFGGAEQYLGVPGGRTSTYLPHMVRKDLRASLSGALNQCRRTGKPVQYMDVLIAEDEQDGRFTLAISPVAGADAKEGWYLVELKPQASRKPVAPADASIAGSDASAEYVSALETDLARTRENLQETVQELETSNEELQATNEELMAANEELQGTNEEMQSVNEELHTVNSEYQHKLNELTELTHNVNLLLQHTNSGTLYLDGDLNILQFSQRFADLLGLKEQDVGRPFLTFAEPLQSKKLSKALRTAVTEDKSVEFQVTGPDNAVYLLRVVSTARVMKKPSCLMLLVDITKWHAKAEAANRLAEVVKQAREAILTKSPAGKIISWNQGAEALFGYSRSEATGKNISLVIPDSLRQEEKDNVVKVLQGQHVEPYETRRLHKNGRELKVVLSLSPIRNAAGDVVAVSSVAYDLTPQKQAEAELRQTVRQREQFLALLSHELRNPMMALMSASTILQAPGTDAEVHGQAAASIQRQVDHLSNMLNDLLDASRMRRDKIELRLNTMDLTETVDAVIDEVRPAAEAKNIHLKTDISKDALIINGDAARLKQLQVNLLMNAVRYSPNDGRVCLKLTAGEKFARIIVRDNGIGILPETLGRIFEPFYQGRENLEDKFSIGLGLSLAKSIVTGHGGKIDAESGGPGKGAIFTVTLPLSGAPYRGDKNHDVTDTFQRPTRGKHILLVDDDDDGRESLAMLLRHRGHRVHEADCGIKAVNAAIDASTENFDVALVDIGLPDISGVDVGRQILDSAIPSPPRLIALSGFGQEKDIEATRKVGFELHLVKPVDLSVIEEVLQS